jgi:hypothetical protein
MVEPSDEEVYDSKIMTTDIHEEKCGIPET